MNLRKLTLTLVVVILVAGLLRLFGGDGLPFDKRDVSRIKFRYSLEDSTQVVVENFVQVQRIIATLRVKPKGPTLCAHFSEVVLTINDVEHTASICGGCFDLRGEFHGYFKMPPEFLEQMATYRDSVALIQPWDGM